MIDLATLSQMNEWLKAMMQMLIVKHLMLSLVDACSTGNYQMVVALSKRSSGISIRNILRSKKFSWSITSTAWQSGTRFINTENVLLNSNPEFASRPCWSSEPFGTALNHFRPSRQAIPSIFHPNSIIQINCMEMMWRVNIVSFLLRIYHVSYSALNSTEEQKVV